MTRFFAFFRRMIEVCFSDCPSSAVIADHRRLPKYPRPWQLTLCFVLERKKATSASGFVDSAEQSRPPSEVAFTIDVIDLLQLDNVVLLHEFHCVEVTIFPLRVLHTSEGSHTQGADHLEFRQTHFLCHAGR